MPTSRSEWIQKRENPIWTKTEAKIFHEHEKPKVLLDNKMCLRYTYYGIIMTQQKVQKM